MPSLRVHLSKKKMSGRRSVNNGFSFSRMNNIFIFPSIVVSLMASNTSSFTHIHRYNHNVIKTNFIQEIHGSSHASSTYKKTTSTLELFPSISDLAETILSQNLELPHFPFDIDLYGKDLFNEMNIGESLEFTSNQIPEDQTSMVLESIGKDLLVFLAASVIVTPISQTLGISPILGYLILGATLGPHALNVFSNTKADVELGDFGILFLLFSEGLEVTSSRLNKLTNYVPLGLAQISLTAGVLTAGILSAPEFLERFIPLDGGLINISNPLEALVLALAGTLSTSAFVFPVLKEKEWEDEKSGEAATSILLLQDLAVAPLLVLLPFIAGQGVGDSGGSTYSAIAFLTLKATLGFGGIIYFGSNALRKIFNLVAKSKSSETFVALCLLVSAGMGTIAKEFGLTDTAGAFVAGILLANTNYRAQVQADILPFKGILLGIFFMDAGSSFDLGLVLTEFPTVITGVFSLILLKTLTVFAATKVPQWMEPNRLPESDALKLSLLLAGGGEFAFVVLAVAERLDVLPKELGGLLTSIVLITMALTPLLGDAADQLSEGIARISDSDSKTKSLFDSNAMIEEQSAVSSDAVVICGYDEIGQNLASVVGKNIAFIPRDEGELTENESILPRIAAFDINPLLSDEILAPKKDTVVLFGDGANPEVLRSSGVHNPSAIFISYQNHGDVLSATSRLRNAFEDAPIFARSQTRFEAQVLKAAGATEVVIESEELPRSAMALILGDWERSMKSPMSRDLLLKAVSKASNMTVEDVEKMLACFYRLDQEDEGVIKPSVLATMIRNSNSGVLSDEEIDEMEGWIKVSVQKPLDYIGFCKLFVKAPDTVKQALADTCLL